MRSVILMSCVRSLVIQSSTRLKILNPPAEAFASSGTISISVIFGFVLMHAPLLPYYRLNRLTFGRSTIYDYIKRGNTNDKRIRRQPAATVRQRRPGLSGRLVGAAAGPWRAAHRGQHLSADRRTAGHQL